MSWIVDHWEDLGTVVGKAVFMYVTAVVGLRLGERRILAPRTIIDFATAVAVGAIVGRTAIAHTWRRSPPDRHHPLQLVPPSFPGLLSR